MPELPEVEVLARHLRPFLIGKTVRQVQVLRPRVIAPTSERHLVKSLRGAKFVDLSRRGKYLIFSMRPPKRGPSFNVLGHLGMTGRFYPAPKSAPLPKHAAVVLDLGRENLIYEDTRYFGRFTLDTKPLALLGPEPFGPEFTAEYLASALSRSSQPIKVKLLDQSLVAGVGNIYASEALFRAGISPKSKARKLSPGQIFHLHHAIREVLEKAIRLGSSLPLDFSGNGDRDGLFYYGNLGDSPSIVEERFLVYDRAGKPCANCATSIKRLIQSARSTYFCPQCQA